MAARGDHPKKADLDEVFPIDEVMEQDNFGHFFRPEGHRCLYCGVDRAGRDKYLCRTWPPTDQKLDAVAQLCGAAPGFWTKTVRETGLLEHVCQHGVGHPDPASATALGGGAWHVHGCDGCCRRDDFPGRERKDDVN